MSFLLYFLNFFSSLRWDYIFLSICSRSQVWSLNSKKLWKMEKLFFLHKNLKYVFLFVKKFSFCILSPSFRLDMHTSLIHLSYPNKHSSVLQLIRFFFRVKVKKLTKIEDSVIPRNDSVCLPPPFKKDRLLRLHCYTKNEKKKITCMWSIQNYSCS